MPAPVPPSSSATQRALLRALLRGAAPAVNFSPHATANLRRLLLAGQREQLRAQGAKKGKEMDQGELQMTTRTLLLLLAAARPAAHPSSRTKRDPVQPSLAGLGHALPQNPPSILRGTSGARPLAHRLIGNLASLTYHHLSPYTYMPRRVSALIGGSDSRRSRRERARVDEGVPLAALQVPAKPPRGPIVPPELRAIQWKPPPLVGIEELHAEMEARRAEIDDVRGTPAEEKAKRAYIEARGKVKTWTSHRDKEEQKRQKTTKPRRLLLDVIEQVQARRIMLGKERWRTWKEDGWLGD